MLQMTACPPSFRRLSVLAAGVHTHSPQQKGNQAVPVAVPVPVPVPEISSRLRSDAISSPRVCTVYVCVWDGHRSTAGQIQM